MALVAWSLSGVTLLDLDQDAARAGGPAFLLERYLVNLSAALAKSPLMVVDHRQLGADAR